MPRTESQAKPAPAPARPLARWLSPPRFVACVMALYLLACLPVLALHHFDASVFVVAGDHYVDAANTDAPLHVKPDSNGYDGQFYYRLAVHPFGFEQTEGGITFDHPAKRMQRILFPLLAYMVSSGHAGAAAWAMLGLNLCGLAAIAWMAASLARRLALPGFVPLAILLWPGFAVCLLDDTTEIVSTAFLLAALGAYLGDRLMTYALLAACAVLTRETTALVFAGLLLHAGATGWARRDWRRISVCALPFLPFAVWQQMLSAMLHQAPQADGLARDLGWPLLGALRMLLACISGTHAYASTAGKTMVIRVVVLATAPPLLAFCALVASRLPAALRRGQFGGLAVGWILIAALMSLLTATGPWVEPVAYFRAFTECAVVGWLLLGLGEFAPGLWLPALCAGEWVLVLVLCVTRLR